MGPRLPTLAELRHRGASAWLNRQLKPSSIDDHSCDQLIAGRFPRLSWSITDAVGSLDVGAWDVMFDLGVATLARAAWSQRQLQEVMVDFWSNHLNITNPSSEVWATRHDWDRNVIRKHVFGKFSDMLVASATHPAMMLYLNNAESTKDLPNENYGRELLELHSVGVDAGYSEEEMYNSTLIMTGFSVQWDTNQFQYHADAHHTGHVSVLGWSSKNANAGGGYHAALSYVRYLAHHPSTAKRIAQKLCERFVSDTPQPALVQRSAHTFLANDTAIVPVLRQLFASKEFAGSIGAKVRRPMQDVVSTVRILDIAPDPSGTDGMQGLYWMVGGLGDSPMSWAQPNGYPDVADAWRSAGGTLGRWNAHMSLAAHWWPTALQLPDLRQNLLPAKLPATHGALVDALAKRLVFRTMSSAHHGAVLGFLGVSPNTPLSADDDAVNSRLPIVVALILDSPYFQVR